MFNFLNDIPPSYTWPVELEVPISGKKYKTIKFEAEFNRLGKSKANEMLEAAKVTNENGSVTIEYQRVFDAVLIGLSAKDDSGRMAPLPDDVKDELMDIAGAESAIFLAYCKSLSREKAKN